MSYFHLHINDLIRIKFGPFILDNLKRGEILQVEEKKLSLFILLRQLHLVIKVMTKIYLLMLLQRQEIWNC